MVHNTKFGKLTTTKLEFFPKFCLIKLIYLDTIAAFLGFHNLRDQQQEQQF
jgi:hypothetical protein